MTSCVTACDNGEKPDCSSCHPWNVTIMLGNSTVLFLWVSCSAKNFTCSHCFNTPNNCIGRYYYYPSYTDPQRG